MAETTEEESSVPHWVAEKGLHPAQIEAYRRMTPAEKIAQMGALNSQARKLKAAGIRLLHPDWSEEAIQEEVRRIFLMGAAR